VASSDTNVFRGFGIALSLAVVFKQDYKLAMLVSI